MTSSTGALFIEHQRVVEAVDRLVESGCSIESISLLMSDRTLQRSFSLSSRQVSELPIPFSPATRLLASELKPLAPLGAPGAGMVGTGPIVASLERAGLGSACGIQSALQNCGVADDAVTLVVKGIRSSGILVFAQTPSAELRELARNVFENSITAFELEGNDEPLPQGGIWLPTPMQSSLVSEPLSVR